MVEVFRNIDSATVGLLQSVLESEGIATFFRNQNLSSNEVTIPSFYPALCVMNPDDEGRAKELIQKAFGGGSIDGQPERKPWNCDSCGEKNPGVFELCWNCQVPLEMGG